MKKATYIAAISLPLLISGCVDRAAQAQAKETAAIVTNQVQTVAVTPAKVTTLIQNMEITGEVTTSSDTQVGAKTSGRIVAVNVRDGDYVKSGEVLAVQDTTPLVAQLNQARAGVLTAMAGLAQAQSQLTQALRNAQVGPYRSTAAVQSAQASLRQAQSNLDKMQTGARPQERRQAEATLNSAKANLDVAKKQLDRIKILVQQGALAGSQLDTQEAAYETSLATYQNAQEAMSLIQQGNRIEDISAAKEQVAQAKEALMTAEASKDLDPLLQDQVGAARAAVQSAKATIDNAKEQVVIAQQAVDDAVIKAPFAGQVSGKPVEVGTIAGPGTTILRIIGSQGIYFEGNVPSDGIDKVKVGMPVNVSVASSAKMSYPAKVAAISPLGSSVGRLFTIRVQFVGAPGEVRPGMFATGEIRVLTIPNATVVPTVAIIARGDQNYVFLDDSGKAKKAAVTVGLEQNDVVEVKGIPVGSLVVVAGQDRLSDGAKINVQKTAGASAAVAGKQASDKANG